MNPDAVIESIDVPTIYEVPLKMLDHKLDEIVLKKIGLPFNDPIDLADWINFVEKIKNTKETLDIALVGKYTELADAYKSICESFVHAGAINHVKINVKYVNSENLLLENIPEQFKGISGILVAPGFGNRGIEGKIEIVRYAREHLIPFFGICLGMQCCVIEFARNVLGYKDAHSTEMDNNTSHPVIDLMEEQKKITNKGATMRLGSCPCILNKDSKIYDAYQTENINERHRHRYEFNGKYLQDFRDHGFKIVGTNPNNDLVEAVEIENHPWFVGVQFHPEYKSTALKPHPLFISFVNAALQYASS